MRVLADVTELGIFPRTGAPLGGLQRAAR